MRVYLDNAASTPLDKDVLAKMIPVMEMDGNPSSVHSHGRQLRAVIEKARKDIAEYVGAAPAEIFFTSGGTEADNMAIKSSVSGLGLKHIVSTRIEHHAVTHPIEDFEKAGLDVTWLDVDAFGHPDLEQLEKVLSQKPRSFVSLMHANNELGTLLDLERAGAICAKYDAVFHSDTVQSMAHVHYHLKTAPVHMVSAAAHKFYGPKGIGFLYLKTGVWIPPMITGGAQERNMRAGTEYVAGIAGMAFALEKCYSNLEEKTAHLRKLKNYMKARLESDFPGISFNGSVEDGKSIPTVLNVVFPGTDLEALWLFNLDIHGISASGGSACTSGSVKGSHVLHGIGCDAVRSANSVRFSFGVQNTLEEIDYVIGKIKEFSPALVR